MSKPSKHPAPKSKKPALKQEGAAEADGETWMALERRTEPRGEPAQASSSMSQ